MTKPPFIEPPHQAQRNRDRADAARVWKATLADGRTGVLLYIGGVPAVLTREQAIRIASEIADQLGGSQ